MIKRSILSPAGASGSSTTFSSAPQAVASAISPDVSLNCISADISIRSDPFLPEAQVDLRRSQQKVLLAHTQIRKQAKLFYSTTG